MTRASHDKQNWAKLVEEIQQAKAAFDASPSGAPSVEPNPAYKTVTLPAAPEIAPAPAPAPAPQTMTESNPVAQRRALSGRGNEARPDLDNHELIDNIDEFNDVDESLTQGALASKSGGIRSHLGWGIAGFVIGAVCWHLIGFWTFVGDVVFTKDQNTTVVERSAEVPTKPRVLSYVKKRSSNATTSTSTNCSAFYRDADTGMAQPTRCQKIVRSPGSVGNSNN